MKAATIIKDGLQLGIFETYYSEQPTHTIRLSLRVNTTLTCSLCFVFFLRMLLHKHYCYSLWVQHFIFVYESQNLMLDKTIFHSKKLYKSIKLIKN